MTFNEAVNTACRDIPEGWCLQINLFSDSGWIELATPDGDEVDPDNWQYEEMMADQLRAAVEYAKTHDQKDPTP